MKKKIVLLLGLVAMLGTTNVIGVYAAEGESNAKSNATVSFDNDEGEGGEEITPPVDPEEPGEEIDPDDEDEGGSTGNTGKLRIDYVSNFKFPAQKITAGKQIFYAELVDALNEDEEEIQVPNFVQVSDLRGSGDGWTLYVSQDQFKVVQEDGEEEKEHAVLKGAVLTLDNITPNTINDAGKAEAVNSKIELRGDSESKIVLLAEEESGFGTHVAYFGDYRYFGEAGQTAKESVMLDVPASAVKYEAAYKSILTWTLADAPDLDFE